MSNQANKKFLVTYANQEVGKASVVNLLKVNQSNLKDGVSFMSAEKADLKDNILHFENVGISLLELTSEEAKELSTQEGVLAVEEDVKVFALDMEPEGYDHDYQPEVYINQEEMAKLEEPVNIKGGARVKGDFRTREAFGETVVPFKAQDENTIVGDKTIPEEEAKPFNFARFSGQSNLGADNLLEADKQVQTQEGGFADGYKKAMMDMFSSMLDANIKKESSDSCNAAAASAGTLDSAMAINASYIPWNIRMVKAPEAWARGYDGWGVKVAVLDTGIDYNHPDLYVYGGADFTGSGNYMDYYGHGTHCAGIIAAREYRNQVVGVAPRAKLYAVKVLGNDGWGDTSNIIAGMDWCVKNGIKVASMSLGGAYAPTIAYREAVSRCQQNGVLVVASAGNSGRGKFPWVGAPANSAKNNWWSTSPIAVGAVDINNNIAAFSSRGRQKSPWNPVGCVAPGVNVRSTYLNKSYTQMDGTSMACPHVSGLAALLWERWGTNTWTYWIKKQILIGTYYGHSYPKSVEKGFGLINCDRVVSTYEINVFYNSWKEWYLFR
ncbi:S8 family peptidase [Prevotella falsenii]